MNQEIVGLVNVVSNTALKHIFTCSCLIPILNEKLQRQQLTENTIKMLICPQNHATQMENQ